MDGGEERGFRSLRPGVPFQDILFAPRQVRVNETGPRVTFALADRDGETRRAVLWEASSEQITRLHTAMLLRVTGALSGPEERFPNQVTVMAFEAVEPRPEQIAAFLPPLPDDHAETRRRFDRLAASVANPHLAGLLERVFGNAPFRARFEDAVAAGSHHHAYRGGLLRHTVEVAELCRAACRTLPFLRHDLLVTAALLHDLGKVWEMEQGLRAGEYTAHGALIGHVHGGAFRMEQAIRQDATFPGGLRDALLHLLLSHHERPEWGSPKTPALPEAVTLAQCDQISAHATEYDAARQSASPGQRTHWRPDGRPVCVDPLGLDALDLSGFREEAPDTSASADVPCTMRDGLPPLLSLPVRGLVAAGDGGRSSEEPEETGERVTISAPPGGADYVATVTGESMVGAGILPGDRVCVRHQETASVGEIVVAYVPGSGNVIKRFDVTPAGGFLFSENPDAAAYPPLPITEGVRIQGVVTRVERDLNAARR